ncbi:MAG: S9 family peptidase [Sphingomonas sp.]|nr:S9 family peptidase [Sphingomonas sp.]
MPAIADAAISPSGNRVALATSAADGAFIHVVDLDARQIVLRASVPDHSRLRSVGWADDGRVTFEISRTFRPGSVLPEYVRFRGAPRRVDYYRTGVLDLATRRVELLTTNQQEQWQDQGAFLIAPIEGDQGHGRLIGATSTARGSQATLFRVNLASGRAQTMRVPGANADTLGFLLDERGTVVARFDSHEMSNRWSLFVYDRDSQRLLMQDVSETGAPISALGLLPDGRIAVLDEDEAGEFRRLFAIDRTNGQRSLLFAAENHDVGGAIVDPWTRRVVGVHWTEEDAKQRFFDAALQAAHDAIAARFAGGTVMLQSWSRDRRRILVYGERSLDGGGYYVFSPADETLERIGMLYPDITGVSGSVRHSITYRARDGTAIPAYLTLPGAGARGLPLVLLVHGGPHARDTMGFDWWAAFLVSRGYAVLQPNFRGSTGYGASWERAGRRQWGGLMQDDVEDGLAALVRAGIADPRRVCIVGASYGGYAALAGATLTPDLYRCAASVAGVADLNEFLRQRQAMTGERSMTSDWWRLSIGDRAEDRDRIRDVSPVHMADRIRIPILLMHGSDDTVVPIAQSRRMLDRLRAAGRDVRFVELRGDDHWLSDAETRIQMLRELEEFLAANLGAG